jgi:hypothetical protein
MGTSNRKLKNGTEEMYTVIIATDQLEAIKNIAHWDRKKIKDVLNAALSVYLEKWQKQPENNQYVENGSIKPRP